MVGTSYSAVVIDEDDNQYDADVDDMQEVTTTKWDRSMSDKWTTCFRAAFG